MVEKYSNVYVNHNFFIHLSIDGNLGYVNILAIVNNAVINIEVHIYFLN